MPQQQHPFELVCGIALELRQRDRPLQLALETDVDHVPRRVIALALGIVVLVAGIESRVIGVGGRNDPRYADDSRFRAVGVIEETDRV